MGFLLPVRLLNITYRPRICDVPEPNPKDRPLGGALLPVKGCGAQRPKIVPECTLSQIHCYRMDDANFPLQKLTQQKKPQELLSKFPRFHIF